MRDRRDQSIQDRARQSLPVAMPEDSTEAERRTRWAPPRSPLHATLRALRWHWQRVPVEARRGIFAPWIRENVSNARRLHGVAP